jgi:hypothetical protein
LSVRGIAREHLHESMDDLQRQLGDVHEIIGSTWFTPVSAASEQRVSA